MSHDAPSRATTRVLIHKRKRPTTPSGAYLNTPVLAHYALRFSTHVLEPPGHQVLIHVTARLSTRVPAHGPARQSPRAYTRGVHTIHALLYICKTKHKLLRIFRQRATQIMPEPAPPAAATQYTVCTPTICLLH